MALPGPGEKCLNAQSSSPVQHDQLTPLTEQREATKRLTNGQTGYRANGSMILSQLQQLQNLAFQGVRFGFEPVGFGP